MVDDRRSPPSLGAQIRGARTSRGLSISELARRSDVSQSFLSQVESDQSDISVGRLVRLAQALDLDVVDLLGRPRPSIERLVRAGEQAELPTPSEGLRVHLLAPSLDHSRTNAVGRLEPGAVAEPAHATHGNETFVYLLEGSAQIELSGERTVLLKRGDSISYRSEEFERMVNPGRGANLFVWVQASSRAT
jgi:transcriptional regulator with XRE-family HTH domain